MTTVTWDWAAATPGRTSRQPRMPSNVADLNARCIAQAFQPVGRNSEAYSAILLRDIGAIRVRYCALRSCALRSGEPLPLQRLAAVVDQRLLVRARHLHLLRRDPWRLCERDRSFVRRQAVVLRPVERGERLQLGKRVLLLEHLGVDR